MSWFNKSLPRFSTELLKDLQYKIWFTIIRKPIECAQLWGHPFCCVEQQISRNIWHSHKNFFDKLFCIFSAFMQILKSTYCLLNLNSVLTIAAIAIHGYNDRSNVLYFFGPKWLIYYRYFHSGYNKQMSRRVCYIHIRRSILCPKCDVTSLFNYIIMFVI